MCLSKKVFDRYSWDAFSVGEDWEFSATLQVAGEKIHFNADAIVYQKESHGFRQASKQRLRWASGRHAVASKRAFQLLTLGLRKKSFVMVDAAITLVIPNFSGQATLSCTALFMSWLLLDGPGGWILFSWASASFLALGGYFLLGAFHTDSPWKSILGIPLIPIFLPWRVTIEILGLLGFGRKVWLRTPR
jgi:cellulose synthase/poly-beta-1,6-N-acetylglucosamine synthase-like glycosyltransferase